MTIYGMFSSPKEFNLQVDRASTAKTMKFFTHMNDGTTAVGLQCQGKVSIVGIL